MEEFKTVFDHANFEISSLGNVKNMLDGMHIKSRLNDGGYRYVVLDNMFFHQIISPNHFTKPSHQTIS